jgi:hypothetical protein
MTSSTSPRMKLSFAALTRFTPNSTLRHLGVICIYTGNTGEGGTLIMYK